MSGEVPEVFPGVRSRVGRGPMAGVRAILLPRNQGSGTARRIGTQQARGQVVGARRSEAGTYKLVRVPAKWAIRKLAAYLTNTEIPDLNSGLRAFKRQVALPYLRLLPAGFSCVTTIMICGWRGPRCWWGWPPSTSWPSPCSPTWSSNAPPPSSETTRRPGACS